MFLRILSMRARSTLSGLPRIGRIAWFSGSRPRMAEPPAESPSTMNSSASSAFLVRQSVSLPGRPAPSSADLRRVASRAWRAATRARAACVAFVTSDFASDGCSSSHSAELVVGDLLDRRAHRDRAELALGLAFELRVLQLHRDDGGEAFTNVFAERGSRPSPSRTAALRAYLLTTLVSALRKPSSCVPPSGVSMPLANEWMPSW